MSVETFFNTLDDKHRMKLILSHMQYPKTAKLREHDTPVLTTYYTCEAGSGSNHCNFSKVKEDIVGDTELRAFGATSVAKMMVEEIEKHPEEFLPHRFDGYQVNRGGYNVVRIQRKQDKMPATSGRMGSIEYNDLRAEAMEAMRKMQQEMLDQAAIKAVNAAGKTFCSIQ